MRNTAAIVCQIRNVSAKCKGSFGNDSYSEFSNLQAQLDRQSCFSQSLKWTHTHTYRTSLIHEHLLITHWQVEIWLLVWTENYILIYMDTKYNISSWLPGTKKLVPLHFFKKKMSPKEDKFRYSRQRITFVMVVATQNRTWMRLFIERLSFRGIFMKITEGNVDTACLVPQTHTTCFRVWLDFIAMYK